MDAASAAAHRDHWVGTSSLPGTLGAAELSHDVACGWKRYLPSSPNEAQARRAGRPERVRASTIAWRISFWGVTRRGCRMRRAAMAMATAALVLGGSMAAGCGPAASQRLGRPARPHPAAARPLPRTPTVRYRRLRH